MIVHKLLDNLIIYKCVFCANQFIKYAQKFTPFFPNNEEDE